MSGAPDVVLMTCHDIGRHLHCYGVETVRSRRLDALAEAGVLFTQAFATAPQCSPSRASLATGLYPHNNGVMGLAHAGFDWEIADGVPHAAALFRDAGLESHLFGNQHVTLHPERLGFHELHSPGHDHGNATGMTVASAVEEFLVRRGPDVRLYLEINFDDTHRPYPVESGMEQKDWPVIPPYLPPGPEAAEEMRAAEASIEDMDAAVGRVLDALDRCGRGDALVVFTTDHGLAMPRAKCTLYDPGLEVALMMRFPGAAPRSNDELVSNIDVLPTMLEAGGAAPAPHVQGRSLMPLLRGEPHEPRDAVFAEKTFHSYYDPMRCIRTRTHKHIRNFEAGFGVEVPGDVQLGAVFRSNPGLYSTDRPAITELYDLVTDPLERHNLAGSSEAAGVEAGLQERLWSWMAETDDPLLKGPVASPRYRAAMKR